MTPRFSIITPVYDTPPDVLSAMLQSVTAQSFVDWEACIVDDGSSSAFVRNRLRRAAARDKRIRVAWRPERGGIVAASNDALAMTTGEFIALLDHDDQLHSEALRLVDKAITAVPEVDYLYTDEDKIDAAGRHSSPFYKPDWSPERFRTQMYTCHLSVIRRSLAQEVGGFDPDLEGSQDWDLILRVTERSRRVVHVPKVLYHWRTLATSTAGRGTEAKAYAYAAGTRALQAHCKRVGFPAVVEHSDEHSGVYHLRPALRKRPLVSIIIPTGGTVREVRGERLVLVTNCVRSIVETSTYDDYELVCVADTGVADHVIDQIRAIAGSRLRLVRYEQPFNFPEKINRGSIAGRGEHLLLLNDDTEIVTPDWIERMVMYSSFPGIGAVGAKLIYEDGRLQHVGVMMRQVSPGHLYRGFGGDYGGYANTVRVAGNYLAVTGACLMTSRAVFERVGGLGTEFPLNFNDIDYCLKARTLDLRVVYDPDTLLYHFESSSRSMDVSDREREMLRQRWSYTASQDPYDNPNFDRSSIHMVPRPYFTDGSVPAGLGEQ